MIEMSWFDFLEIVIFTGAGAFIWGWGLTVLLTR